jgi:two-component system response regulator HydG
MRRDDLDLRELFDFDPAGGVMRFAGERALIVDAVAMGLLRKTLIETLGAEVARGIITRFGYVHGRRSAETMKTAVPWDTDEDWRLAGGRLHKLQGLVVPAPVEASRVPGPAPFVENVWHDSYEAEQHLMHLGRSRDPVCWSQCGFASGYLSYANQQEIYCLEVRCRGRGDAACHMVCRTREQWGDDYQAQLVYFEMPRLDAALEQVAKKLRSTEKQLRSRRQHLASFRAEHDVTKSPTMLKLLELVERVSQVDSTVLVTGESGVGKERIARMIHDRSARSHREMVAINCGALPENLLESELFGHAKGSFTGATQDRAGLFEEASGGTLFLDEIGEVTPAMQVKLLRALQEQEVRRVGENKNRKDQSQSREGSEGRAVSPGPLLSAPRDRARGAAAARTPRGHPGARARVARDRCCTYEVEGDDLHACRRRSAPALRVAGKCSRARECARARGGDGSWIANRRR